MINLLIVEDDFVQAKNLANLISSKIPDIRIYNLSTDGKSAINVIKKLDIDLILLDLKLPDISGIDIINYIINNNIEKYKQSIIIVTGEHQMVSKIIDNPYIFAITYKANSFDILINNINLWKKSKLNKTLYMSIKKIIIRELKYLNYNLSHIGTKYLIDTIIELYYSGETTLSQNLTKTVYPILSRKYNKSINNIKINITRATTNMYYNCPEERLQNFFGFSSVIEKPHSKEIIYIILNKLAS